MQDNTNKRYEEKRIWSKPILNKLGLALTKSALGDYNQENKVHGGPAGGAVAGPSS